ncbi:aminoglycoside phosphotransferase family protein [Bacillus spongiae]|uniref:Aminoglycoside phosphotransferase family protein n=1 Tax=Bacillus spongiae TaxID=2683610 RepID=A0ABU8H8E7_9BACI
MHQNRVNELLHLVKQESVQQFKVKSIVPLASGVENCVFKAKTEEWGEVVIRVPWIKNNESRKGLQKEYMLSNHCAKQGIPIPSIFLFYQSEQVDFLVQRFVSGELPEMAEGKMGELVNQLHHIEIVSNHEILYEDCHAFLSERIVKNNNLAMRKGNIHIPLPSVEELYAIFQSFPLKKRFLHMDIRKENMIYDADQIVALFDWTNAIMGDPVLELMRIDEYGLLNEDFINGYQNFEREMARVPTIVQLLYRYHTVAMLTNLFCFELKDLHQGEKTMKRLYELRNQVNQEFSW